jgi:hypothetical protein
MNAINTLYRRSMPAGTPPSSPTALPPRAPGDTAAVLRQRIAQSATRMDPALLARMSDTDVLTAYDMVAAQSMAGVPTTGPMSPTAASMIHHAMSEQEQRAVEQMRQILRPPSNKKIVYGAVGAAALIAAGVAAHYFWQKRRR